MNTPLKYFFGTCLVSLMLAGPACETTNAQTRAARQALKPMDEAAAHREADELLAAAAKRTGTTKEAMLQARSPDRFTKEQNVFFPGTIAVDFKQRHITLPVYQGLGPDNSPVYYILTEAADFKIAKHLGVNFAPKLANGRGTEGS